MSKQSIFVLILVFVCSAATRGQDFEDFKKQINDDYRDFRQKTIQSFNAHVAQTDKAFADYLVEGFGEYSLERYQPADGEPKPQTIPVHQDPQVLSNQISLSGKDSLAVESSFVLPIVKKSETGGFETREEALRFFGSEVALEYDVQLIAAAQHADTPEKIAAYWTAMSKTNYNHLIEQLNGNRQRLNLNDWGYYQLIKTFSEAAHPGNGDMQSLLSWFLLSRSGYKARIAFNDDGNYLMISSLYPLAGSYVRINQVNYYLPEGGAEQLQTYGKDVPQADRVLDLSIAKPLNLAVKPVSKLFRFAHHGKEYEFTLQYNKNLVDFYTTMPQAGISLYFNSLPGTITKHSVTEAFAPLLRGKTNVEAAALLLSFVQQAFEYKTDREAYGEEKYMFAEELLHYPFSDCEDRAVLYAWMVKTLLNLEVAGVEFPGHMATAIHFGQNPPGEFIVFDGKQYVLADPTFTGAPPGMLMPGTDKSKAQMIVIKPTALNRNKTARLWEIVHAGGGYKGDVLQDVVFAPSGNAYVCGYFTGEAHFGQHHLVSDFEGRDVFIAKFDTAFQPVWAKKATGPGDDMAYSLALDPRGILYVYGSLQQTLDFDGTALEAIDAPDVFVARYGPDGNVRWVSKAGIDKIDHSANFMFSAKFNPEGEKIAAKLYNETMDFDYYGLHLDDEGNAVITGSFFATTGLNTTDFKDYSFGSGFDMPRVLKDTNDRLYRQLHYERTIAGLFAALRLMRLNSIQMKGNSIQQAIETYNEPFTKMAVNLYKNMGEMSYVINNNGIVVVNTENRQPVDFSFIRISDNARFKIVAYENGNAKIDVLSGIELRDVSGSASFDMNSISLSREKGDLLLDYDDDHTKITLNLKTDLLQWK